MSSGHIGDVATAATISRSVGGGFASSTGIRSMPRPTGPASGRDSGWQSKSARSHEQSPLQVRRVVSLHPSRRGFATDEHALACFAACGGDEDALHRPRAARHADHRRCAAHALLPHGGSTARLWPTVPGELRLRVRVKIPSGLGLAPARRTYRPSKASPRPDHALTRHLHPDTSPQPRRRWRSSWRRCSSCPSASR